jgi:hypothetical protein
MGLSGPEGQRFLSVLLKHQMASSIDAEAADASDREGMREPAFYVMDYCVSSVWWDEKWLSERGLPGGKPFCKRCSAHGEQCLCAGTMFVAGEGH